MKLKKYAIWGALSMALCGTLIGAPLLAEPNAIIGAKTAHANFKTAIYIAVNTGKSLADKKVFDAQFARAYSQVKFDKVYLETYRDRSFASDEELRKVKSYFAEKGIEVAGGITLAAGGKDGQFGTFDYENPSDVAEAKKAVELTARHFDEIILDDFFFYNSKTEANIKAKGEKSWSQYRLEKMREVSKNVVLDVAHGVNPKSKVIIKYPNWYEHFQGTGYDLEKQSLMFDGLYTGTETRDPIITDQLLQEYESYLVYRYYKNIRPDGHNGGGWVDTFSTLAVDRYAEQLWLTLFAKAPEITLFNWHPMSEPNNIDGGTRAAWANKGTSFDWDAIVKNHKAKNPNSRGAGWGSAAGAALEIIDPYLAKLGNPIGIASYKPFQSSGEDFLHNYLGNMGLPIELSPYYPTNAKTILLTEAAKHDPQIIEKIKISLRQGANVFVTSGFVNAMQNKGFRDILEVEVTGNKIDINDYFNGYGAGNGYSMRDNKNIAPKDILFPDIRFYTNDSWAVIRGVGNNKAVPILLMNQYSAGNIHILNIPENMGELYDLPLEVFNQVKTYVQKDFPIRLDAPDHVALFAYDNNSFVVQSFRDEEVKIRISLLGANKKLLTLLDEKLIAATAPIRDDRDNFAFRNRGASRTEFEVSIKPHSFLAFKYQ